MKKIFLTLSVFGFVFFIFGCAHEIHEMSYQERLAQYEKQHWRETDPCYRLWHGKIDPNLGLRPEERHAPADISARAKRKAKSMCKDQPYWSQCQDWWMEFTDWQCRVPKQYHITDSQKLESYPNETFDQTLKRFYREEEESSRRFQEQIDRDFLLDILMDIDLQLMDLNNRMPLR